MRRLSGILAAAFFLSGSAHARIGDTEGEIEARHGKSLTALPARLGDIGLTKCYSSGGFLIAVTFLKGKSAREVVTKADASTMSTSEIFKLLDARTSGATWNVQDVAGPKNITAGVQQWRSTDQKSRVAFYDSQTRALFITTQNFINLTNAKARRIIARGNLDTIGGHGRSLPTLNSHDRGAAMALRANGQQQTPNPPAK